MSGALTLGNANTLRAYLHVSAGKRGSKGECFPLSSSCTGYVEMSALGNNRAKLIEAPFVTDVADTPATQGTPVALLPFGPETDVRSQQSVRFRQDRSAGCALLSNTPICLSALGN
jgi:hypothetical protein